MRKATVLFIGALVGACSTSPPPPTTSPPAPAVSATGMDPTPMSTATAGDAAAATEADAGALTPEAKSRSAPIEPVLVFRRIDAGALPAIASRETWTIARYEGGEVVITLVRDESSGSVRLSGEERRASTWTQVSDAMWSGRLPASGDLHTETTLRLEQQHQNPPTRRLRRPSSPPSPELTVKCKSMKLPVLGPTASLVPGDACGNGGRKPYWRPSEKKSIVVERCTFAEIPPASSGWDGELSFAREPGVEWAFENSDCSAQEGDYRQIATPDASPSSPKPRAPLSPSAPSKTWTPMSKTGK